MNRRRVLVALFVLSVLAVGHWVFWYLPREHAAAPDPGDLPAHLLTGAFDSVLWVAYPHQNLAALEEALGGREGAREWLAALARRTDLSPPELPSFGPFPAPPARELALARGRSGRVVMAARVFPLLAGVARMAGWVAGNPWLSGGEVEAFGDRVRVAWRGTLWTATSEVDGEEEGLPVGEVETSAGGGGESLAVLGLGRPTSGLPAGAFALRRPGGRSGDLELATPGAAALTTGSLKQEVLHRQGVLLAAINGKDGPLARRPGLLLLLSRGSGRDGQLPAWAVVVPVGSSHRDRLRIPAEGVYSVLGGGLERAEVAGWEVLATDGTALEVARELASFGLAETARAPESLALELWLDPGGVEALVRAAAGVLASVPVVRREEIQRWQDWATVLAPLARFESAHLVSTTNPAAFRLRLVAKPH